MILAITLLTLNGRYPSEVAANGAKYTAVALAATMLFDLQKGIANVIRADVMAMLAFYFLTLFEFLFPQRLFDTMAHPVSALIATQVVITSFIGILVGRHFIRPKTQPFQRVMTYEIPPGLLILIFWVAFCVGYMHQWTAPKVNWDPVKWINYSMAARFGKASPRACPEASRKRSATMEETSPSPPATRAKPIWPADSSV